MHSCLYVGQVRHRRLLPRPHQFHYRLFMAYLDLDELPDVFQKYWLWSTKRTAVARFRRNDHLGDNKTPLATAVRDVVEARTGQRPLGPIRLLTHLAYFGYRFNPVSFYYCYDEQGHTIQAIVAEINNTPWGEQYCYVLGEADNSGDDKTKKFQFDKDFHVSPFMPMDMRYDWRFTTPGKKIFVHMENYQDQQKQFDASLQLTRNPINSANLAGALLHFPFMTIKVITAIYYQALRLWLKRIPFYDRSGNKEAPDSVKPS